jgi:hypothetical protein
MPAAAEGAKRQRPAADPLEVELVAGEEEEHAEAEVGEEIDEVVGFGQVQHVGADDYPQQQLDHDDRRRETPRQDGDRDRGKGGDHDDDEERLGVDLDQGARSYVRSPSRYDGGGPC